MVRKLIGGTLEREVGAPLSKLWTVRNLDDGCQTVGLSDYRTLSDCRMYGRQYGIILTQQITVGMAVGHCRTVGLSDCRTVGLSDCRTVGLSDCRTVGLSDCRTVGLSDCRTVGTVGLSDCRIEDPWANAHCPPRPAPGTSNSNAAMLPLFFFLQQHTTHSHTHSTACVHPWNQGAQCSVHAQVDVTLRIATTIFLQYFNSKSQDNVQHKTLHCNFLLSTAF